MQILVKGTACVDTGTFNSLMQASQFVPAVEEGRDLKMGVLRQGPFQKGLLAKGNY